MRSWFRLKHRMRFTDKGLVYEQGIFGIVLASVLVDDVLAAYWKSEP